MARQRVSALPADDLAVPNDIAASVTPSAAGDGAGAELVPFWRPDLPAPGSDFQSLIGQVVELAKILTGASGSAIALREGNGTICRATSGQIAPPVGAPVDTFGISKQCLDSGMSLCCEDIATDRRVDPKISQSVGIRGVAVVPIYTGGEIAGILEVFSGTPRVFTDQHLKRLQQLANFVGSAASVLRKEPSRGSNVDVPPNGHHDIALLVELEPAYRAFFRNLADLAWLRTPSSLADSSSLVGWDDVFVDSYVPWKRFVESIALHIVVIGMLSGLSRIWPQELLVYSHPLRGAHVTYYPPSQSFPALGGSRPRVHSQKPSSARQKTIRTAGDPAPRVTSGARSTNAGQQMHALTAPPAAMPTLANSRLRKMELGAVAPVLPPPDIGEAQARQLHLPNISAVVPPPPDLRGGLGFRKTDAPRAGVVPPSPEVRGSITRAGLIRAGQFVGGSAGTVDIGVVPPPPSLNDRAGLTYGVSGAVAKTGVQVVGPPPSLHGRGELDGRGMATSPGRGVSQVVPPPPSLEGAGNSAGRGPAGSLADADSQIIPPPPSLEGAGNSVGRGRTGSLAGPGSQVVPPPPSLEGAGNSVGKGRTASLAGPGSQVVPPPPSMQNGGSYSGSGRMNSLAQGTSQVVPPPPSIQGGVGSNSAGGGRAGLLARSGAEDVLLPGSARGDANPDVSGASVARDISTPSTPQVGANRSHPVFQDVELRVVGLVLALPHTSYFSNYEVYVAEKWISNEESQLIKLVYVFLPYQRRLSEYGVNNLKVRKLRVTRDPTCDESLMQMVWPEGENAASPTGQSGDALASKLAERKGLLPCYRTTADDYRRAVSKSR